MVSAREHPEVIEAYLSEEVRAGRIELRSIADQMGVHCSSFGVIPKKGRAGKWRLIVDLGHNANDGVDKDMSSLSCLSVNEVMSSILGKGRGTLLAKTDIQQAYRNIPVCPEDRFLLRMEWKGVVYLDTVFPFGLRSAPLLFTAVGDALQWVMSRRGIS